VSEVVILVPMLGRAHRVEPLLESIESTTPEPHRVLFLASPGDECVHAALESAGADRIEVARQRRGDYARKINTGVRNSTEPLIFTGADDLRFHPHWLERAVESLTPGIGVVGTNDLGSKRVMAGEHATHLLFTRRYVNRFGTIDERGKVFHEGYWHEFVDDEAVATAKHRNAWAFAHDSIVEHLHPNWGKAPNDQMYAMQRQRMRYGRVVFERRRHLWT
jgi:glycosyltransferase involved in cell wall biosynthesis